MLKWLFGSKPAKKPAPKIRRAPPPGEGSYWVDWIQKLGISMTHVLKPDGKTLLCGAKYGKAELERVQNPPKNGCCENCLRKLGVDPYGP